MNRFYKTPSAVIPDDPEDPRWPDAPEERCARYPDYYTMFWQLQVINQAQRWARCDKRKRGKR